MSTYPYTPGDKIDDKDDAICVLIIIAMLSLPNSGVLKPLKLVGKYRLYDKHVSVSHKCKIIVNGKGTSQPFVDSHRNDSVMNNLGVSLVFSPNKLTNYPVPGDLVCHDASVIMMTQFYVIYTSVAHTVHTDMCMV